MHIRDIVGHLDDYHYINREERNYVAALYHILQIGNNKEAFLALLGYSANKTQDRWSLYMEYAYLRDLWDAINEKFASRVERNKVKREVIMKLLKPAPFEGMEDTALFNEHFGASSKTDIRYPGNWSIIRYDKQIECPEEFVKVCRFKWCFNAKPDLVLHLSKNEAICLEAKLESGVSTYPCVKAEKDIFKRRKLPANLVSQTEVQQQLMAMLGIKAHFVLLTEEESLISTDYKVVTWQQVLKVLDLSAVPKYMKEMLRRRFNLNEL